MSERTGVTASANDSRIPLRFIQATLAGSRLLAWLGPAIGPTVYEVGEEVREAFTALTEQLAAAFQPASAGHWHAAYMLLEQHGVGDVYGGEHCSYTEPDRFFSHRRDGVTGRMATCIWLEQSARSEGGVA